MSFDAYLDIETSGIGRTYCDLTVVGIAIGDPRPYHVFQLVAHQITAENILGILRPVGRIYTYNGSRFDLPIIRTRLGLDLRQVFVHVDLMYHCWSRGLKGGLKAVERQMGIQRGLPQIDGRMAVDLWWRYVMDQDTEALRLLLEYNREDVLGLDLIRRRLQV